MTDYSVANVKVGKTGYGLMGFSWDPTSKMPQDEAIQVMKSAVDGGATFWNGGEFYGKPRPEENLELIRDYFKAHPEDADKICLSIKGATDPETWAPDGSESNVRRSIDTTLKHLKGLKKTDLFCIARVDKAVGIEVAVKVVKDYVDRGEIGGLCLSECSVDTIKQAMKIMPVSAVEIEYSLWSREAEHNGVFNLCAHENIPVIAYAPLGRGYLTGAIKSKADLGGDMRAHLDRFSEENMEKNAQLVEMVKKIAEKHNAAPGQIALEWIRQKSNSSDFFPVIIPIPGSRSAKRVAENVKQVNLSKADILEIDNFLANFEVQGGRYNKMVEGTLYQ